MARALGVVGKPGCNKTEAQMSPPHPHTARLLPLAPAAEGLGVSCLCHPAERIAAMGCSTMTC